MLKTIDLFAGAGGLSLGFEMTGQFKVLAAAEINKNAQATYRKNLTDGKDNFIFIDNVLGYDFASLSERFGGVDVVIGGPPCQGFSNANRQKNHLISMNNGLVKEYFRAVKEIRPKVFVMENVNMLRSDTHRFYESTKDCEEINLLREKGYDIPKREDTLYISEESFQNINYLQIDGIKFEQFVIPAELLQLISVLNKNIGNDTRLPKFLRKNSKDIIRRIDAVLASQDEIELALDSTVIEKLSIIKDALETGNVEERAEDISYVVNLEKMISTVSEIKNNGLIGQFSVSEEGALVYKVNSYSVIDYVNAILGGEYIQVGNTVNAEWFGVPQERRRYIVMGIRKDLYPGIEPALPTQPKELNVVTVGEAIMDLASYEAGYEKEYIQVPYDEDDVLSKYARLMRNGSTTVKNHITTKTTDTAMKRFKEIKQGENFHSLSDEMKSTYAKPERTQNTIYLRLDPDEPSGTVVNVRKSMWIHPTLDRAVTVREAARLQSFPDTFEFVGTKDSQFQQVGNAVPPLLAKGIAEQVLKYIL
jgi:DNA (cytosine-5)-methyltransferase 1